MRIKIGYGEDIHRLVENRRLILAGVHFHHPLGLLGHSDADVVFHAIADALLGALALGDIGQHFPDTDPRYRDCDSGQLLAYVFELVQKAHYEIGNLDVTVIAEMPKIAPQAAAMRANIARILKTNIENISLKAGTNEGLDAIGRGEAIKAIAIVLLEEKSHE